MRALFCFVLNNEIALTTVTVCGVCFPSGWKPWERVCRLREAHAYTYEGFNKHGNV